VSKRQGNWEPRVENFKGPKKVKSKKQKGKWPRGNTRREGRGKRDSGGEVVVTIGAHKRRGNIALLGVEGWRGNRGVP